MTLPHLIAEAEAWAADLALRAARTEARSRAGWFPIDTEHGRALASLLTALSAVARAADAKNPST